MAGPSALDALAPLLEGLGVRYAVGGSLASGAWGEPRSTHDIDLIVDLSPESLEALLGLLEGRFYYDADLARSSLQTGRSFNLIDLERYEKIDIFPSLDRELDRAQLETAITRPLEHGKRGYPITAPEVCVVRKLGWFDKGGRVSDRQWRDVQAILRTQGKRLDRARMRTLCTEPGLAALLEQALEESGDA